mgnify:CR=1 FL=1
MKIEISTKWELIKAIFITTLISVIFSNILVSIFETIFSPPLVASDIVGATVVSGIASSLAAWIIFRQNYQVTKTKADLKNLNRRLLNTQKKLRKQASTDDLTGLYNRRSFFYRVQQEVARYGRDKKRVFSLLLIDIDYFKKVNDTFGHAIGDVTLRTLARVFLKTARGQDIVARTGGEEFCLLLPDADKDEAKVLAERIRKIVSNTDLGTEKVGIYITISIGVAEISPNEDRDGIYNRADIALYRAKSDGRNRVEVADETKSA